jgi:hypothetical protein
MESSISGVSSATEVDVEAEAEAEADAEAEGEATTDGATLSDAGVEATVEATEVLVPVQPAKQAKEATSVNDNLTVFFMVFPPKTIQKL